MTPVIQRQSTDPTKSITLADVSATDIFDVANQGASNDHIL